MAATSTPEEKQISFLKDVHHIHEELLDGLDFELMKEFSSKPDELAKYLKNETNRIIHQKKIKYTEEEKAKIIEAVVNEIVGFGPIEPLLHDPSITDIFVNNPKTIFVERKGRVEKTDIRFLNDEHVYRLVQRVASKSGRHLDLGTPYLDAQLADGSRIHAIIPPIAIDGVKVSIRKFLFNKFAIESIVKGGSLNSKMATLLQLAVKSRLNMVICGGTGSGKTTLLNSLLDSIRSSERVITIEDTPELEPTHGHTLRLITRAPNPEGKGAVTLDHLMVNALRMRPDRVILGELRGSEAFNLLHAMNTGQDGSMATLHASGTEEVLARLLNMILMAKYSLSVESVRQQIAGALDLIIYVAKLVDGSRRVMSISQVSQTPEGEIKVDDLFRYKVKTITDKTHEGYFEQLNPPPPPRFVNKFTTNGLYQEYRSIFDDIDDPPSK